MAKTGRTWSEWVELLDAMGATSMAHRDVARALHRDHDVPGWWAQMVTVGYELQARQVDPLVVARRHRRAGSFTAKGEAKSSVAVQHTKLTDRQAAEQAKQDWSTRLAALATILQS